MMHAPRPTAKILLLIGLALILVSAPLGVLAQGGPPSETGTLPAATEKPSPQYDSILYAEIGPRLAEIAASSKRVRVDVLGQSAGGRDLYLVTLSDPQTMGRLGRYQAIRRLMLTDPEAAQELLDRLGDFKVPVFINASIHGNEYPGVDAAIHLIETLAYGDSPEIQSILESVILLVNVVANPDGRVSGTRANANGFDLNRDLITQSQAETRAIAHLVADWNPMVTLDLHGFVIPMLIEPCTPLHNPNYEYDLYIQWAYYQAEAMEAELLAQTGLPAQIPFRDDDLGWDDWAPSYTPMYAMFHGSYGHTLETPYQDVRGVEAHYAAVWGALKFVAANRQEMLNDQIEIFRRGFLDLPQMLIPDELLNETQFDQYNELTIKEFPTAYLIPAGEPTQLSEHQPARLVDFLLYNDVQVERAVQDFSYAGVDYPAGTYIVWMNQPKRGLANTLLEYGLDLSDLEGITFYSPPAAWSNLLLWGVQGVVVEDELLAESVPISAAAPPQGFVETRPEQVYAYLPDSLDAFRATNTALQQGGSVYRLADLVNVSSGDLSSGAFLLTDPDLAADLARDYALKIYALPALPEEAYPLRSPRILATQDHALAHALKALGFTFDQAAGPSEIITGKVVDYDVWINPSAMPSTLSGPGRAVLEAFFAGGGDYIGLTGNGASLAIQNGFLEASQSSASGNGIIQLAYDTNNSLAGGYFATGSAFVNGPVWFEAPGPEVEVIASYTAGDFFLAGYWPGWVDSGASGKPVILHQSNGASHLTLIGLDITFRGHPEDTFRLLGNAIFNGLD